MADDDIVNRKCLETLFSRIRSAVGNEVDRESMHIVKDAMLQSTTELSGMHSRVVQEQVKKILEHVYGELKSKLSDRVLLRRLKDCIIDSKEEITGIVKNSMVIAPSRSGDKESGDNEDKELHYRKSESSSSSSLSLSLPQYLLQVHSSANRVKSFYRPKILMVDGDPMPLSFHITVSIPRVTNHTTSNIFGKDFVSYEISSSISVVHHDGKDGRARHGQQPIIVQQERRYSDFCELYDNLKKLYPMSTIPSLPPKRAIGEKLKDEWVLQSRRRQLLLWLQFVCSHALLQNENLVQKFIGYTHNYETALVMKPKVLNRHSTIQNEIQRRLSTSDHGTDVNLDDSLEKVLQNSYSGYTHSQENEAHRMYITISRDLLQLEPQACSATAATAHLLAVVEKQASKKLQLSMLLKEMAEIEIIDSCKLACTHVSEGLMQGCGFNDTKRERMSSRANESGNSSNVSAEIEELNRTINEEQKSPSFYETVNSLLETMTFFNNNCLQKSRSNTDRISSMRASKDYRVEGAHIAGKEWVNLRIIRHSMMIDSLVKAVTSFRADNARLASHWKTVEEAIRMIDVGNESRSSSQSSREGSASMPTHAPPPVPTVVEDSSSNHRLSDVNPSSEERTSVSSSSVVGMVGRMFGFGSSMSSNQSRDGKLNEESHRKNSLSDQMGNNSDHGIRKNSLDLSGRGKNSFSEASPSEAYESEEEGMPNTAKKGGQSNQSQNLGAIANRKVEHRKATSETRRAHTARKRTNERSSNVDVLGGDAYDSGLSNSNVERGKEWTDKSLLNESGNLYRQTQQHHLQHQQQQKKQHKPGTAENYEDILPPVPPTANDSVMNPTLSQTSSASSSCTKSADDRGQNNLQGTTNPDAKELAAYGWEEVSTDDGQIYYYHKITRISRWDKPDLSVMEAVDKRTRESQSQIDDAVQRRMIERAAREEQEEEKNALTERLRLKVKNTIDAWRASIAGPSQTFAGAPEMLNSLDVILPTCVPAGQISLGSNYTPADVKKGYMKAVRLIHPDKLSSNLDLETKMLAESVFICINENFDSYRAKNGI